MAGRRNMAEAVGIVLSGVSLCGMLMAPGIACALDVPAPSEKDETVYVYTNADGSVKSIEVEALLKNPDAAAEIADSSNLEGIEGKDDKAHSGSGDALVWKAQGDNVAYKGISSADAPIALWATYMLDGQPIAPDQLAGKSGHITIRYDFANRSPLNATVNGVSQTLFTPFTCITAMMLDGDDFKNVTVRNGKIINDGDDMIIAGYAMPGLKESLGSMADDADVPDHFAVEADVTNFELKSTMTIITAGLMSDIDVGKLGLDSADDASALTNAMEGLIDGSEQLSGGLDTLASSMSQLESGASGIKGGAESLSGGLAELAGGNGLGYLSNSASAISTAMGSVGEAVQAMESGISEAAEGLSEASEASPLIDEAKKAMLSNQASIVGEGKMSEEDFAKVLTGLEAARTVTASVSGISESLSAASEKISELDAKISELENAAEALASGISSASSSAWQLEGGAEALEGYAAQLSEAMPAITQGAQAAAEGSKTLTQGMRTFNDQGVSELVNTLQNDYGGLLDRINALSDAAKSYTNFSGITPGTSGSVKFVFETDGIKKG